MNSFVCMLKTLEIPENSMLLKYCFFLQVFSVLILYSVCFVIWVLNGVPVLKFSCDKNYALWAFEFGFLVLPIDGIWICVSNSSFILIC